MKKYVAIVALILLIVWGIYDIKGNKSSKNETTPSVSVTDNLGQSEELTAGLENGDIAPDFELKDLKGKTYRLSDLRGKKVIVNFWSTGCPSCRLEIPDMEKFYSKYKDDGVEILAVNLVQSEKNIKDVSEFVEAYHMTFPVLLDERSEASRLYNVYWIPHSFIIDTKGVIREQMVGPMTYDWMEETLNAID